MTSIHDRQRGCLLGLAVGDITDRPDLIAAFLEDEMPQVVRFSGREYFADTAIGAAIGPARAVISAYYMDCR